jgi:hypothetical protein
LLETATRGVSGYRLLHWKFETVYSPERHPMMMVVATRLLLPSGDTHRHLHLPARPQHAGRRLHRRPRLLHRDADAIYGVGLRMGRPRAGSTATR